MSALQLLPVVARGDQPTRTVSDRLEVLEALIAAPTFDDLMRPDVITIPRDHPVHGWGCSIPECAVPNEPGVNYCPTHATEWRAMRAAGKTIVDFRALARPLQPRSRVDPLPCLVCPDVPSSASGLCFLHTISWWGAVQHGRRKGAEPELSQWVGNQRPYASFGTCRVVPCPKQAGRALGLCGRHDERYRREGSPGQARAVFPPARQQTGPRVAQVLYGDQAAFERWCGTTPLAHRAYGTLSLLGLRPLVKAEIRWALFHHMAAGGENSRWPLAWVQYVANACYAQDVGSLADLDLDRCGVPARKLATRMLNYLRLVYFSRQDTKAAGFIELDHFGVRFERCVSHFDLSEISQRWLRDLLWDWIALRLTADPPQSRNVLDAPRRGLIELSAFLEAKAPQGGHNPAVLTGAHMVDFVADQRHRAVNQLPALATRTTLRRFKDGLIPASPGSVASHFNAVRRILRDALESGAAERIGLDRAFIVAVPSAKVPTRRRNPFPDDVARALADHQNLLRLQALDPDDHGVRDVWETLVLTGRRCSEVIKARLDCTGRLNGVPMFWHDQTKVGNFDDGIRIPDWLFDRLAERQVKSVRRFEQRHGRPPTAGERREMALFPSKVENRYQRKSITYSWFNQCFRTWIATLDLPHCVAHQARHTLATKLLKAGANLTHIKRYLGHVSTRMTEHYVHIANTDPRLEEALNAVWVSGPGSAEPGLVLSTGEGMTRQQAEALAIDLSRKSTPAEGGFCTFQPVVNGDACPWNLNCHNCDKFVLSGADLVYWHRKREQWRTLAERAPDPATADFLHDVFAPTARAIDGLEKALAAIGLLDEALALDLRRPQDYFGRVWNTAFRAQELACHEAETSEDAA